MNLKKQFKSFLSLLIVVVMMFSVAASAVSATGVIELLHKDNAGNDKLHYVSLGASNTNGYGHDGYLPEAVYEDPLAASKADMNVYGYLRSPKNSYPSLIKDALESSTGREVELHQLAISSMRVEEVLYLLDDSFTPDAYMNWRFTGGSGSWFEIAEKGGIPALREAYTNYITEADVITVDLGWNNFGVYAFNNIKSVLANDSYWKEPSFDRVLEADKEEEYYAIKEKAFNRLCDEVDLLANPSLVSKLEKLADVLAYATFGACYNFDKVIERIYALNPDAEVVVINIQNLADGLVIEFEGQELPIGDLYGELIEFVDLYRASVSPYADKYSFAYAGDDGDVATFLDDLIAWDGDPASLTKDMKDCMDMYDDSLYARSIIEYVMIGQVLSQVFAQIKAQLSSYGLTAFEDDDTFTYSFYFDQSWLAGANLGELDLNNPETDLEKYGAIAAKHLASLRKYEKSEDGLTYSNAYDYVFESLLDQLKDERSEKQGLKSKGEAIVEAGNIKLNAYEEQKATWEAKLQTETDPTVIAEIEAKIEYYENEIARETISVKNAEDDIDTYTSEIEVLDEKIIQVVPYAQYMFNKMYEGVYTTYQNTLDYAYATVATILQYAAKIDTLEMSADSMKGYGDKSDILVNYIYQTFINNATAKFYYELGANGLAAPSNPAPEITVDESVFADSAIRAVAALAVRYDFGNSFFAHPSVEGNKQIRDAVMNALENGTDADAFTDKKLNQYIDVLENYLNPYYQEKYAELKANGTIDAAINGLDALDSALDALEREILAFELTGDVDLERAEKIKDLLIEEIANTRETSKELRRLLSLDVLEFNTADYAKLAQLQSHLVAHVDTLGALALEIGHFADPYIEEIANAIEHQINVLAEMASGAYGYLAGKIEAFNAEYLEFVELAGSYADKIDSELGEAVRAYLLDTPNDALNIIAQYGEDAVLKLIVDASAASDSFYSSVATILAILAEHGEEIYKEITSDEEYLILISAIETKAAELAQLYADATNHPILTAIDIDIVAAKHIEEIKTLYSQLLDLVIKNVKEYDSEVAELLWIALIDVADSIVGISTESGENYILWLDSHTDAMLCALLNSLLENTNELGSVSETVMWRLLNKLDSFITQSAHQLNSQILLQIAILEDELVKIADNTTAEIKAQIAKIEAKIAELKAMLDAGITDIKAFNALIEELIDEINVLAGLLEDTYYNPSVENLLNVVDSLEKIDGLLGRIFGDGYYELKDMLKEMALELLDRTLDGLKEQSPYIDEYLYGYFYNNPEEVIEFFTLYGPYIKEYADKYGDEVLGAIAYLLYEFGDEAVAHILENPEEILDDLCSWYKKYGVRIWPMLKVYLDTLGVEYYTLDDLCDAIEKLNSMAKELGIQLNNELMLKINGVLSQINDKLNDVNEATVEEINALLDLLRQYLKEILDGAIAGEYTADKDSFYVAVTGTGSAYAELLAGALGLSDRYAVMNWSNLDKSLFEQADFVTLEYNQSEINGFAMNQLLASLALYGNDSLRAQIAEYIVSVLGDDLSEEKVAEHVKTVDDAILSVLENSAFAGKTVSDIDWAALVGEENVAYIEAALADAASRLAEYGIDGSVTIPIDMVKLIEKYVPQEGMTLDIFDNDPVFELSIPIADIVMITFESYLYANLSLQKAYAEMIVELTAMNPDVEIALLSQYNPFNNITVEGVTVPLADIYDRVTVLGSTLSFGYALVLSNVTYVDISDVETSWDALDGAEAFIKAYLSNPMGAEFTDSSNLYVMHQILNAYGLSCKHVYDGCFDLECNVCGELREKAEHNYTAAVTAPDCENDGYTTYTCTDCGDSYVTDKVAALGHLYDNDCDDECNRCGATRTPADHVFGDWTEVNGYEERSCLVCGYTEVRAISQHPISATDIVAIVIGSTIATSGIAAAVYFIIKRRKNQI